MCFTLKHAMLLHDSVLGRWMNLGGTMRRTCQYHCNCLYNLLQHTHNVLGHCIGCVFTVHHSTLLCDLSAEHRFCTPTKKFNISFNSQVEDESEGPKIILNRVLCNSILGSHVTCCKTPVFCTLLSKQSENWPSAAANRCKTADYVSRHTPIG